MSTKKYLIDTLKASEKHEFDNIVKTYLREIYGYKRISITDGTGDSGIDIRVFDLAEQKIQYQVTTQKNLTAAEKRAFENKLWADVEKAKENYANYGYSNSLHFFYSFPLSIKAMREYERTAMLNLGINLVLIDANRIADEAEEYLQLLNTIAETNPIQEILKNDIFPSEENNLVFDLVSFGKSSDFKLQIIESYLLRQLHISGKLDLDEILAKCQQKFRAKENRVFYEKLLNRLITQKRIKKSDDKNFYLLSSDEDRRISGLLGQYDLEEKQLVSGILEILKKYNQEKFVEEYIFALKKIYIENFNSDLVAVINNQTSKDISVFSRDFLYTIEKHGVPPKLTKELALELFNVCKSNQFIQKFCAGKVFSETTNIASIERYIQNKKRVFVDTQIALFALCYFYNPHSTYTNYFFNTTKSLLNFSNKNKIKLHLPINYLWEAQSHLRDALNLIPFTQLPNFDKLGKSRNVFYNFFLHERLNAETHITLLDFFENFKFHVYDKYTVQNALIAKYLSNIGIDAIAIENEYNIEEIRKIIQYELINADKFKTKFTLNNDSIVFEFLSDEDPDIQPLQPILLSWDKTLFASQVAYFKKNPAVPRWFIFTPGRFIDQFSLLQFSIDSEMITDEILALLSNELIGNTHTLLDNISQILNPRNEVGLEYANLLANIRDNEIHRLKEEEIHLPDDFEGEAVIDDVFYKLNIHYQQDHDQLEAFKEIFTKRNFISKIEMVISKSIDDFYKYKKFDLNELFSEFDSMIQFNKIKA